MSEYDYAYDSTYLWLRTITITSTKRVQLNLQAPLHGKADFGQIERKKKKKEKKNERKKKRKKKRKKERKKEIKK